MFTKKSLGAVVATALLIVVSVLAVIGFQTWFQTYSSVIFTSAEDNQILSVNFEKEVGDTLYLKSNKISSFDYLSISSINGTKICEISKDSISNFNSSTVLLLDMDHRNSTHIFDLSGYNRSAKLYGSVYNFSQGKYLDSIEFDGTTGNYIQIPFINLSDEMTVGAWLKTKKAPDGSGRSAASQLYYNSTSGNHFGWLFGSNWGDTDIFSFKIANGTGGRSCSYGNFHSDFNNTWVYVVGTYKVGEYLRLYIDGDLYCERTIILPQITYNPLIDTRIGVRSQYAASSMWVGNIDEFILMDKALTSDEIKYLYNKKRAITFEQLIKDGISSIDLSNCNLSNDEKYNLLILGDNVNIQQTFIAK